MPGSLVKVIRGQAEMIHGLAVGKMTAAIGPGETIGKFIQALPRQMVEQLVTEAMIMTVRATVAGGPTTGTTATEALGTDGLITAVGDSMLQVAVSMGSTPMGERPRN